MNRKEIEAWLYDSDYLFKEAYKDIQTICGTKQYHVELLEAFQSALLKAPNIEYKPATPQLNQLRKLLLEQKQLDPEINKLVNDNFWDLI